MISFREQAGKREEEKRPTVETPLRRREAEKGGFSSGISVVPCPPHPTTSLKR
jgi:hypothetical protein